MAEERRSCIFAIVVGYGTTVARIKTYQIIGGGASKNYTQKIKITVALLYINYEPSLI